MSDADLNILKSRVKKLEKENDTIKNYLKDLAKTLADNRTIKLPRQPW